MDFKECVEQRYATKRFDGRPIPDAAVRELLELVRLAPSALNLQPWRIRVVSDPAQKEALKPAAFGQEQITTCSHLLVFCADPDYGGLIRRLDALLATNGVPEETRSAIVEMAARFADAMTPEQRLAWSQAQTYLALSNALHGAKSLGFDSCPMTGFDPAAFSRLLAIPGPLVPVILCPIGYAADSPGQKIRLPLEEILV